MEQFTMVCYHTYFQGGPFVSDWSVFVCHTILLFAKENIDA